MSDLDRVFSSVYKNDDVYVDSNCHANVIRLFNAFKDKFPNINANEFKVLYIVSKARLDGRSYATSFFPKQARSDYSEGQILKRNDLRYHVVLEYQGQIYDLDNTDQPAPMSGPDYLDSFFMDKTTIRKSGGNLWGVPSTLRTFVIPGEDYLLYNPDEIEDTDFYWSIFETYIPVPLLKYLQTNAN